MERIRWQNANEQYFQQTAQFLSFMWKKFNNDAWKQQIDTCQSQLELQNTFQDNWATGFWMSSFKLK